MEKKFLKNFIKRKYFYTKFQRSKENFLKLFNTVDFIASIIDVEKCNNPQKAKQIIEEYTTWKNKRNIFDFNYKKQLSQCKYFYDSFVSVINIFGLKPCQEKRLRNVQLKFTEFAKEITDFFDKNHLQYFMSSGTLLGAIRHKGFIPWDDDIDVGMMRQDYERLKEILRKNFVCIDTTKIFNSQNNKLKIQKKTIARNKNKIICYIGDKYTQFIKGNNLEGCTVLDIFPHDYYADNYSVAEHKKVISELKHLNNNIDNVEEMYVKVNDIIKTNPNIAKESNKIFFGLDSLDSYLFAQNSFIPKDVIFPLKKMTFENFEFFAPNKPEEYIKFQYKDYLSLPPILQIAPDLKEKFTF